MQAARLLCAALLALLAACGGSNERPLAFDPPAPATGPLRVSRDNPRYFDDGHGRIVYLTGSHTWANLIDSGPSDPPPRFDYDAYLDFLGRYHHNFFRLWTWEQARWVIANTGDYWFAPLPYRRTGPGLAFDGKPRFDLAQFDPAYFARLRQRVQQASRRGIYVSVMLFDGWSIEDKNKHQGNPWPGHPFHAGNNVNGIDGDPERTGQGLAVHSLRYPAITALQEAYVRQVIDTVNDLDNVMYEISNESRPESHAWQYHMIDYIRNYEATKPKQHPVGMTVAFPDGDNDAVLQSRADWVSINDSADYRHRPPPAGGGTIILADTDHLCGICGDAGWVWKSFLMGYYPVFMDPYDGQATGLGVPADWRPDDPNWEDIRRNLGYTLAYARRFDLAAMRPHPELASTGYCLAKPAPRQAEYLVYLPRGGVVEVDLSGAAGELAVEWFYPRRGVVRDGGTVRAGGKRLFLARLFEREAVLYIH